ncbi:MAG: hypothetical protein Q4D16_21780, partial [Eubacteriales bacterium]|nr:hypothetical protein [Eubacteriales bacterium]
MKRRIALLLTLSLTMALPTCVMAADAKADTETEAADDAEAADAGTTADNDADAEPDVKSEGVMTYEEYMAAELDSEVVVETYVQAKQSWWEDKATLYTQDKDGAYFVYNAACSEEDYEKLVPGTKIKVTGFKAEWSGEIEIMDATFEIQEGEYVAPITDVTDLLGTDDLIQHQKCDVKSRNELLTVSYPI